MSNLDEMYTDDQQRQLQEQEEELYAYYEKLGLIEYVTDEDYVSLSVPERDDLDLEELDFNEKEPNGSILDAGRGLIR